MIVTAQQIIEDAAGMIGVYDGTSPLTQWEYQTALSVLNDMIDSWNNLNLMVYAVSAYTVPFVPGTQIYTVGTTYQFLGSIVGTALTLSVAGVLTPGAVLLGPGIPPNVTVKSGAGVNWVLSTDCGTIAQESMGQCLPGGPPSVPTYNWNFPRPSKIEKVSVLYPNANGQPVELVIPFIQLEDWQAIPVKWVTSTYPTRCYNDDNFPYMALNFWPVPASNCNAILYAWDQIGVLTSLTNNVEVPMGYNDAIKKCLAIELALRFPGCAVSPDLMRASMAARKAINNINQGIPSIKYDPMFTGRGGGMELESHGRVSF
jgi:hypothetical protein